MTEAEPEIGHLAPGNRFADDLLLRLEPGMSVFLPYVHRTAHDPQGVIGAQIGNRLAFVELDRIPGNAVFGEKFPEYPGMLARNVLEHGNARG